MKYHTSVLEERLANEADIREVIFEEGNHYGNLRVSEPKNLDFSKSPLLMRAAEGASVLFDSSKRMEK